MGNTSGRIHPEQCVGREGPQPVRVERQEPLSLDEEGDDTTTLPQRYDFRVQITTALATQTAVSPATPRFTNLQLVSHMQIVEEPQYTAKSVYTTPDRELTIQPGDEFVLRKGNYSRKHGAYLLGIRVPRLGRYHYYPISELDKIAAIIA